MQVIMNLSNKDLRYSDSDEGILRLIVMVIFLTMTVCQRMNAEMG